MADVMLLRTGCVARFVGSLLGRQTSAEETAGTRYGGLIDPVGMEAVIRGGIAFRASPNTCALACCMA